MRTRTRRIAGAGLVLALGVAMTGCDAVYAPRARVEQPAAGADPEQVAAAFLGALSAKDWDTASSLVRPGDAFELGLADSWMTQTWSLRSITVDPGSDDPGGDQYGGADTQFAEVRAEFDPHWFPWVNPVEHGMDPGPLIRFVVFGRAGPGQRWLVVDEGSGP